MYNGFNLVLLNPAKQPFYAWLQNPKGAHAMPVLISESFPLHGTFHLFT